MPKHFKLRTYQRVPLCGGGYYLSQDFLGRGTVWDVSVGGWRIEGDHQVRVGMMLTLRMDLHGEQRPLEVEQAIVQWVSGRDFGVQIRKIRTTAVKRLERLIGIPVCSIYSSR
jgi:hypothetical protein